MARSRYIYVVTDSCWTYTNILGTFTVKHELISWMNKNWEFFQGNSMSPDVFRFRDNGREVGKYEDITQQIYEEMK